MEQSAGGGWTGLVGMLLRKEIDVIAADLTVTASRLAVMDFSKPFMSSSITLLLKVISFNIFDLLSANTEKKIMKCFFQIIFNLDINYCEITSQIRLEITRFIQSL